MRRPLIRGRGEYLLWCSFCWHACRAAGAGRLVALGFVARCRRWGINCRRGASS